MRGDFVPGDQFCFDDDGNWLGPELDELDCDLIDLQFEEEFGGDDAAES